MSSYVIQLSDLSKSMSKLEITAHEIDLEIQELALQLQVIQNKMSQKITQRDALLATSDLISTYRKNTYSC